MKTSMRQFTRLLVMCLLCLPLLVTHAQDQEEVTIVFMINQNEFSEAELAAFEAEHPGIKVERIPEDYTRLQAMFAAGNPPDLIRVWESMVPQLVANNLLYDLTEIIEQTDAFSEDNLADAAEGFVLNDRTYGIPKDWSPMFLYVNNNAFEAAGIEVPSANDALTYDEIAELASQLTQMEGDRVLQVGFAYDNVGIDRDLQRVSKERGEELFADDFSSINLTENQAVMTYLRFLYDLSENRETFSALNPSVSWWGQDFIDGRVAMVPTGFWFQGFIGSAQDAAISQEDVTILPLPSLSGNRLNPLGGTVGTVISADTKNFDAAYELFEFYNAGLPAENRASGGWGVPTLNSLMSMMPSETSIQQQAVAMLEVEIGFATDRYDINPFISGDSINTILNSAFDRALNGELSFEEAIRLAEEEINLVIEDGMFAAGM